MEKRNQLQAKFDSDVAGAEEEIEELFGTVANESYVSKSFSCALQLWQFGLISRTTNIFPSAAFRVDFTSRLMALFKMRGEIETQIIAHSRALEQACRVANNELREVLKGKLEDIDEGLKVLSRCEIDG